MQTHRFSRDKNSVAQVPTKKGRHAPAPRKNGTSAGLNGSGFQMRFMKNRADSSKKHHLYPHLSDKWSLIVFVVKFNTIGLVAVQAGVKAISWLSFGAPVPIIRRFLARGRHWWDVSRRPGALSCAGFRPMANAAGSRCHRFVPFEPRFAAVVPIKEERV